MSDEIVPARAAEEANWDRAPECADGHCQFAIDVGTNATCHGGCYYTAVRPLKES